MKDPSKSCLYIMMKLWGHKSNIIVASFSLLQFGENLGFYSHYWKLIFLS